MANKKRLTIAEQLAKKQFKIPGNLPWLGYGILAKSPFFGGKYHVKYTIIDDINKCNGPAFIIWNHLSRRDYIFVKNIVAPRKFNMLAGYSEFFKSHLHWLFKEVCVIPKKNFAQDPKSIRAMDTIIRQGGTIAFSPEGLSSVYGHNQPVVPGTGSFLKHYHIPVYFMKLAGAYLTSPKTCTKDCPGRVEATLSLLFKGDDLKEMSTQEIEDKINEEFRHDDYEWNKVARIKFKTKKQSCKNMDTLCYQCPKCGAELTMEAHDNIIRCTKCGNSAHMNDYYDLIPDNEECVFPESPSKWVDWQRANIIKEIRNNPNFECIQKVKIGELPKYEYLKNYSSSILCGEGTLKLNHDGIHFNGIKNNEPWTFDLPYSTYHTVIFEDDITFFNIYINDEYYDFIPEEKTCAKIYLIIEEMHRLHFNTWKNFPWFDYLYEKEEK